MKILWFLLLFIFILCSFLILCETKRKKESFTNINKNVLQESWNDIFNKEEISIKEPIYCLMVTGKDGHMKYAIESVRNFLDQSYPHKHLIIVNHHPFIKILDTILKENKEKDVQKNIHEFYFPKDKNVTLGDLRNFSLSLVPMQALWTLWDDDDWRHENYLDILQQTFLQNKTDILIFTKRYEYNLKTGYVWMMELKKGFPIFFARQNPLIQYNRKNTMEDTDIIPFLQKIGYKIFIYENDPHIYVRISHGNNTSLYVSPNKNKIKDTSSNTIYKEYETSPEEKIYVKNKTHGFSVLFTETE